MREKVWYITLSCHMAKADYNERYSFKDPLSQLADVGLQDSAKRRKENHLSNLSAGISVTLHEDVNSLSTAFATLLLLFCFIMVIMVLKYIIYYH